MESKEIALPRPLRDEVLVRQDPPKDRVAGGLLYVPQGKEDYPPFGTVLRVGPGLFAPDGTRIPMDVKPGDRILFKRQPDSALVPDIREGDPSGWNGLLILDQDHILAIVEDELTS